LSSVNDEIDKLKSTWNFFVGLLRGVICKYKQSMSMIVLFLIAGGRIVPRFQELSPEKLGRVCSHPKATFLEIFFPLLLLKFFSTLKSLILPGWIGAREIFWHY
jgi:hypothetical protein